MARWQKEQGFTLIETVIVTALVSLIFLTVALYYRTSFAIWERNNNETEVRQQARVALTKLVSDLQQTRYLRFRPRSTASWQDLPAGFTLELQTGSELLLSLPPGTTEEGAGAQVHYYMVDDSLIRCTGGHNPIAMHIAQLVVEVHEKKPLVRIELVAARESAETTLVTSAYLRNLGRDDGSL